MKKSLGVIAGAALAMLSASQVLADEATDLKVGKKIYDRAFGRGCGACHDISSNPQLVALIKEGSLTEDKFTQVIKNGRNGMPKAVEAIMAVKYVTKKGYTEDQAIAALYKYLAKKAGK